MEPSSPFLEIGFHPGRGMCTSRSQEYLKVHTKDLDHMCMLASVFVSVRVIRTDDL